jgi:carbonic anhydrase
MQMDGIAPDEALSMLQQGNARYVSGRLEHPNMGLERRLFTASEGQRPFAACLSCADSRVPVELIFDRGIGDIFVVRVGGNVLGRSELASLEYASDYLGIRLILVLGHTHCGTLHAVFEKGLRDGNLRPLALKILPAVEKANKEFPGESSGKRVLEAVKSNVWNTVADTFSSSKLIREKVRNLELKIIGAFYDLETGQVNWMGQHPRQEKLLGRL